MRKLFMSGYVLIIMLSGCASNTTTLSYDQDITLSESNGLKIAVSNDMHLLSDSLHDDGELFKQVVSNGDGKVLNYSFDIFNAFLDDCVNQDVDVIVLNGDLTLNGEKQTHLDIAEILTEFEKENDIDVVVLPGNHDIDNPWARSYSGNDFNYVESVSLDEFKEIYNDFGYSEARSSDIDSDSYLVRVNEDVWFLMLDATMHNDAITKPITNGKLSQSTLDYVSSSLQDAKDNNSSVITFMHHNIIDHSENHSTGFTINNADELIDIFKDYQMNELFSGHIHAQDIKTLTIDDYTLTDIATSSLSLTPNQYGLITSTNNNDFVYQTQLLDVSSYALNNSISDVNLLNFDTYSRDLFTSITTSKFSEQINNNENLTEKEKADIISYLNIVNFYYFSGTINENYQDLINNETYQLIIDKDIEFISSYISSLVVDDGIDDNYYEFSIN